jgi:FixJ family two-component response regulator
LSNKALIAIVDDDEPFRVAMEGLVRSLGHRAVAYPSAETFLDSDLGRSADCVVSDIQMPGMNGFEMKQRMDQDGVGMGVIFVTARSEPFLLDQAMASGAVCLLRKPFEAQVLVDCLARALDK